MRIAIISTVALAFAVVLGLPAQSQACGDKAQSASLGKISVQELATAMQSKEAPKVFDANGEDTRAKLGSIPGAVLLASTTEYDTKLLGADKDRALVFYCYSEQCSAAPQAAKRAVKAGFTNVKVLEVGITGWANAGQKVSKTKRS